MIRHLVALLALGLMCGSELNVALFSHPVLKRQPLETHVLVRSSLAALLGRVMPFWMAGSAILNLLLLLPFEHLTESVWLCLVKTKSTFEINNLKKRDVTMFWRGNAKKTNFSRDWKAQRNSF
jgi:hypothetical protein